MSLTITTLNSTGGSPSTPTYVQLLNVVLDNSYPTGGYTLGLQAAIGTGRTIGPVTCIGKTTSTGVVDHTRRYQYNRTTDKLVASSIGSSPAEVSNATDLSTITVEVECISY